MPGRSISREHEEAADNVAQVLENSGFIVDREVNVEISGPVTEEFNLDVCGVHKDGLVIVEVKTEKTLNFKLEILGWSKKKEKLTDFSKVRVLNSRRGKIRTGQIKKIRSLAVVILPTKDTPGPDHRAQAEASKIKLWNPTILSYYGMTARTLGVWTRYEIMRDINLQPSETERPIKVVATKGEQPGGFYYYCTMRPLDLLRVAYVYRRSNTETLAYQRIVRRNKIESMTEFLRQPNASLPNNVIIAIDPDVASEVDYKGGRLTIPGKYCSAWIVDGQHRLYGFIGTKFSNEKTVDKFDLPVVIYQGLNAKAQAAMFVDINNNQKKIDATLLADLSTVLEDLSRKETWPSTLGKKLAESGPFKGLVRTFEISFETERQPITLAGLSKFALTRDLLAPRVHSGRISEYKGPLFTYAPFDWQRSIKSQANQEALMKQVDLLQAYFSIIKTLLAEKWTNSKRYGVTTYTGVNALLLVLNRILETGKTFDELKIGEFLRPIAIISMPWTRKGIRRYANYAGFRELANKMIRALNKANSINLETY